MASISFMIIQLLPLLVPCVFADRVQKEVRLIKDFLACKLYENTLDQHFAVHARNRSYNMPPCVCQSEAQVLKPCVPLIAPATTAFRLEHSITTMLLSGRNKHGGNTSPDELIQKALHY
ncbi:jg13675 [Pararge aegeria aegeria]|uniref:Jg13675 protein n=1 Tax=Pararge aegeria aegeria TaxID=348720 RepID=A0A8S4SDL5_9NEOP|nr:jg13675 [Pararge aegeria aegeria]